MSSPDNGDTTDKLSENITGEKLVKHADQVVRRLITLCRSDDQTEITPDIIIDGEFFEEHQEQRARWMSQIDDGFGIVINRFGGLKNDETEINVVFYPYNRDQTNLLENIEAGLAQEWAHKFNIGRKDAIYYMEMELKRRGKPGMSLACLKLCYKRDEKIPGSDKSTPEIAGLSLSLADSTTIKFDPVNITDDGDQEQESYKNMVYKRLLERLESCLVQEASDALQQMFSRASYTHGIIENVLHDFSDADDDAEDEDLAEFPDPLKRGPQGPKILH